MTLNTEIILIRAKIEKLIMNYQCMIMARIDSVGTVIDVLIRLMLGINAIVGHSIKIIYCSDILEICEVSGT